MFDRHDRVSLLRESSGVPEGTAGIVMIRDASKGYVWVQFEGYGAHEVPEQDLEAATPGLE